MSRLKEIQELCEKLTDLVETELDEYEVADFSENEQYLNDLCRLHMHMQDIFLYMEEEEKC